jgi:hypothetical protein
MEAKEYAEYLVAKFKKSSPTTDYDFQVGGAKDYNFNAIRSALTHISIVLEDTIAEDPMFLCYVRDELLRMLNKG